MDKSMSVPELYEHFRQHKQKIMEMDNTSLSEEDIAILIDCASEHKLLCRAMQSLELVNSAIAVVYEATGETTVETLMEQKQALENLRCLTNGMDKKFVYSLYSENLPRTFSSDGIEQQQRKAVAIQDKIDLLMDFSPFRDISTEYGQSVQTVTVADMEKAIVAAEALMEQYNIPKDNIANSTLQVVSEKYQKKELYVFQDVTSLEEEHTNPADDLVIVESNDGYVMATNASPELFAQNPSLERDYSERVRGNEVVHNEAPKETTIDMAKVGGNVKYEQYDDIGTIEKEKGVPTYEERIEMSERTERETSGNGKSSKTTTTKTTKIESYER
jgi:hypothetical protein